MPEEKPERKTKKKRGRPPTPRIDAPTKSVVDFVLRTRKPAPKEDA